MLAGRNNKLSLDIKILDKTSFSKNGDYPTNFSIKSEKFRIEKETNLYTHSTCP
jgi:hypothetical protein